MTQGKIERILAELRQKGHELEWVEVKENNDDPQAIGEYLSALSNAAALHEVETAYLIFGISHADYQPVGTTVRIKDGKKGNENLESWLARLLNPRIDFSVHEATIAGKRIIWLEIQAANSAPVSFSGEKYIRVGDYKKLLSDYPEKERKLWLEISQKSFETIKAVEDLEADEALKLIDYPAFFELLKASLPTNQAQILDKLLQEGVLIRELGNRYSITNFGAILFAKNLKQFANLQRKSIRVIVYKSDDRLNAIKEQEGGKGYAIGFEGLVAYITDQLPQNEEIGLALRREVKIYPTIAIRELVANALIHQDFNIRGSGPMVEIFNSRIEISNPGTSLIDPVRLIDHTPRSRNEKIASFLRRVDICEERGSGIDKTISAIEVHQLPPPKFVAENDGFKAVLYAPKPLRKMASEEKIRACYQHCCLKFIATEFMTNESLRNRFNIGDKNYSIASRIIADTTKAGLIKPFDPKNRSRRIAKYVPFWG